MREIRPIEKEEVDAFLTISANAYPGIDVFPPERRRQFRERMLHEAQDPAVHLFALFEVGQMRGVMRLFDFTMKLLSTRTLVGGVGGVAVDLPYKKRQVAADLVRYFLQHYRAQGACLVALYPFRPDFYRRMGFGYGTKMNSYSVTPHSLANPASAAEVALLGHQDLEDLETCYDRYLEHTNGLMERLPFQWRAFLDKASLHIAGIRRAGAISGYLAFEFIKGDKGHFLSNDILVRELIYDTADDLRALLAFLRQQADQVERIIFNTHDDHFHHLLHDPRLAAGGMLPQVLYHKSNQQGLGIMYRVIDVPRLFTVLRDHNFGGQTCRLRIELEDSFFPPNAAAYTVQITGGKPSLVNDGPAEVTIALDVSAFSSLVVGAARFARLVEYGLVQITDAAYVDILERVFAAPSPLCLTAF